MSSAIDYTNPANCRLHAARLTGGLCYTPNCFGDYSMYSPPCSGCTIGVKEKKLFGDINKMRNACFDCKQSPDSDNVRTALDAISVCLSSGDRTSVRDAYGALYGFKDIKLVEPRKGDMGDDVSKEAIHTAVTRTIATTDIDDFNDAMGLIGSSIGKGGLAEASFAFEMLKEIYENKAGALR
jgi:hypothetical protein